MHSGVREYDSSKAYALCFSSTRQVRNDSSYLHLKLSSICKVAQHHLPALPGGEDSRRCPRCTTKTQLGTGPLWSIWTTAFSAGTAHHRKVKCEHQLLRRHLNFVHPIKPRMASYYRFPGVLTHPTMFKVPRLAKLLLSRQTAQVALNQCCMHRSHCLLEC